MNNGHGFTGHQGSCKSNGVLISISTKVLYHPVFGTCRDVAWGSALTKQHTERLPGDFTQFMLACLRISLVPHESSLASVQRLNCFTIPRYQEAGMHEP